MLLLPHTCPISTYLAFWGRRGRRLRCLGPETPVGPVSPPQTTETPARPETPVCLGRRLRSPRFSQGSKGDRGGSCSHNSHTPPTPKPLPVAALDPRCSSGRFPLPESAVPPAPSPPKRRRPSSPSFASHHERYRYISLSLYGFAPDLVLRGILVEIHGVVPFWWQCTS